tara:strand:+ start:8292 stop:9083 length:792 start_codon:yes stop_codon:yes gene_type:complete
MHKFVAKLIGFDRVQKVMQNSPDKVGHEFVAEICDEFNISFNIYSELKYPVQSTIFFGNHHGGAIDFLANFSALQEFAPNLKVVVNNQLMSLKPIAAVAIATNPPSSSKDNAQTREEIREHLALGGNLLVFPAGRVAGKVNGEIKDSEWRKGIFDLFKDYAHAGVPVYVDVDNGMLFYIIRRLFPKLSMLFLMRCLNRVIGQKVKVFIGRSTPQYMLGNYSSLEIMQFFRNRVYELKNRGVHYEGFINRELGRENGRMLARDF